MIPQANPFFPKVSHLQAEKLPKLPCLFLSAHLFIGYLNSQARINNMVNTLDYHPCPSRLASRIILSYFYKLPRTLSLSRMLVEFSLKPLYSTMCGKNFQIYAVHIPWKCIDLRHFYSCPSPLKTRPQVIAITPYGEGNYSFPQAVFFRKSVSPNSRKRRRKLWFPLSKFGQKIWRWLGTLGFLYFLWFSIFSNVMDLQFCE